MAGAPDRSTHSALKLKSSESPLDSLVRRTSSRKVKTPVPPARGPSLAQHSRGQPLYTQSPYANSQVTPPRQPQLQHHRQLSPSSPLLHSHFARNSTATASSTDNDSYLDLARASVDSGNVYQEFDGSYYNDESIYPDIPSSPALRDSWQSGSTIQPLRLSIIEDAFSANDTNTYDPAYPAPSHSQVPTVIISSADSPGSAVHPIRAGKALIIAPTAANFSRPVRPSTISPALPSEEQKQQVLERNSYCPPSPSPSLPYSESDRSSPRGRNRQLNNYIGESPSSHTTRSPHSTGNICSVTRPPNSSRTPSPTPSAYLIQPVPPLLQTSAMTFTPSLTPLTKSPNNVTLSKRPPSLRADSPASLYSTYSFYQLDSATPSPTSENSRFSPEVAGSDSKHSPQQVATNQTQSTSRNSLTFPQTPQEYLHLGIQHHEANRLKESAICFEKSAKEQGGCGVGMLMWGLALRHGWGCEKNQKRGFNWLRRAAESAVEDLESVRRGGGVDSNVVETELVLAIYEVGQCFFQGWGVPKDQKMAVSYYAVAARLGDSDAQNDLAFCLANGKGCKKDRKEAAMWYRAAVAQGQSDIGLAWIYKEKYQ